MTQARATVLAPTCSDTCGVSGALDWKDISCSSFRVLEGRGGREGDIGLREPGNEQAPPTAAGTVLPLTVTSDLYL